MSIPSTKLKVTVLGCGDSAGVPRIGGEWGACDPSNPKNRRTRPSIMVQSAETTLVVDTGPDFSAQLTRESVMELDAVLYTHAHSDHISGMDDLRIIRPRIGKNIPVYAEERTVKELKQRFGYLFTQYSEFYPKMVDLTILDAANFGKVHAHHDIEFIPFAQDHGMGNLSLGYRFKDFAYSTDMVGLDEAAFDALKGIKTWLVDCADLSNGHGTLHANLPILMKLNERVQAEQIYITHLKMFGDYQVMCDTLPAGYRPAYDGLVIEV